MLPDGSFNDSGVTPMLFGVRQAELGSGGAAEAGNQAAVRGSPR
jgi:hypothetical protein